MAFLLPVVGKVMNEFSPLGLANGPSQFPTTFDDVGLLVPGHTFREAWSCMEPTVLSQMAALMRLLRNPYFVRALEAHLTPRHSITDYFFAQLSAHLAIIYGDTNSAAHSYSLLKSERNVLLADHPDWFLEATGGHGKFRVGLPKLQRTIALTSLAAAARAHSLTGLLHDGMQTDVYCKAGAATIGWAHDTSVWPESTIMDLTRLAEADLRHGGFALLDSRQLTTCPSYEISASLLTDNPALDAYLGDNDYKLAGLMLPDDRAAYGMTMSKGDLIRFQQWQKNYLSRADQDRFMVSGRKL
jgi:hypothetical protein